MSSIDSFSGLEGSGSMDPKAFEKFQEQMSENSAVISALSKAQAQQTKNENDLVKIVLRFIQTSAHSELVICITKLLELNVPAIVILSMLFLIDSEVRTLCKVSFDIDTSVLDSIEKNSNKNTTLATRGCSFNSLSIKSKLILDMWVKSMYQAMKSYPNKTLETFLMPGTLSNDELVMKDIVLQTTKVILHEFIESNGVDVMSEELAEFSTFTINGLLRRIKGDLNQTVLNASEKDRAYQSQI